MNKTYNLIDFLKLVIRWRKPILIVSAVATLASIVITDPHIMKPYYKSHAVFYPANPNQTSTSSLFGNSSEQLFYGLTDDLDRMMSIATSSAVEHYLVEHFHLFEHYHIDSANSAAPMTKVVKELESNLNVVVNAKSAIEVTVFDHDREFAAELANAVVYKTDEISTQLLNDNKTRVFNIYQQKVQAKNQEVKMLTDSLVGMKARYNFTSSISGLASAANAAASGSLDYARAMENIKQLEEQNRSAIKELNTSIGLMEQYKSTISNSVPSVFFYEKAAPAEKKAKPIRWLVAVGALLLSFLLTVLAAFAIESFRKVSAALKQDDSGKH